MQLRFRKVNEDFNENIFNGVFFKPEVIINQVTTKKYCFGYFCRFLTGILTFGPKVTIDQVTAKKPCFGYFCRFLTSA